MCANTFLFSFFFYNTFNVNTTFYFVTDFASKNRVTRIKDVYDTIRKE